MGDDDDDLSAEERQARIAEIDTQLAKFPSGVGVSRIQAVEINKQRAPLEQERAQLQQQIQEEQRQEQMQKFGAQSERETQVAERLVSVGATEAEARRTLELSKTPIKGGPRITSQEQTRLQRERFEQEFGAERGGAIFEVYTGLQPQAVRTEKVISGRVEYEYITLDPFSPDFAGKQALVESRQRASFLATKPSERFGAPTKAERAIARSGGVFTEKASEQIFQQQVEAVKVAPQTAGTRVLITKEGQTAIIPTAKGEPIITHGVLPAVSLRAGEKPRDLPTALQEQEQMKFIESGALGAKTRVVTKEQLATSGLEKVRQREEITFTPEGSAVTFGEEGLPVTIAKEARVSFQDETGLPIELTPQQLRRAEDLTAKGKDVVLIDGRIIEKEAGKKVEARQQFIALSRSEEVEVARTGLNIPRVDARGGRLSEFADLGGARGGVSGLSIFDVGGVPRAITRAEVERAGILGKEAGTLIESLEPYRVQTRAGKPLSQIQVGEIGAISTRLQDIAFEVAPIQRKLEITKAAGLSAEKIGQPTIVPSFTIRDKGVAKEVILREQLNLSDAVSMPQPSISERIERSTVGFDEGLAKFSPELSGVVGEFVSLKGVGKAAGSFVGVFESIIPETKIGAVKVGGAPSLIGGALGFGIGKLTGDEPLAAKGYAEAAEFGLDPARLAGTIGGEFVFATAGGTGIRLAGAGISRVAPKAVAAFTSKGARIAGIEERIGATITATKSGQLIDSTLETAFEIGARKPIIKVATEAGKPRFLELFRKDFTIGMLGEAPPKPSTLGRLGLEAKGLAEAGAREVELGIAPRPSKITTVTISKLYGRAVTEEGEPIARSVATKTGTEFAEDAPELATRIQVGEGLPVFTTSKGFVPKAATTVKELPLSEVERGFSEAFLVQSIGERGLEIVPRQLGRTPIRTAKEAKQAAQSVRTFDPISGKRFEPFGGMSGIKFSDLITGQIVTKKIAAQLSEKGIATASRLGIEGEIQRALTVSKKGGEGAIRAADFLTYESVLGEGVGRGAGKGIGEFGGAAGVGGLGGTGSTGQKAIQKATTEGRAKSLTTQNILGEIAKDTAKVPKGVFSSVIEVGKVSAETRTKQQARARTAESISASTMASMIGVGIGGRGKEGKALRTKQPQFLESIAIVSEKPSRPKQLGKPLTVLEEVPFTPQREKPFATILEVPALKQKGRQDLFSLATPTTKGIAVEKPVLKSLLTPSLKGLQVQTPKLRTPTVTNLMTPVIPELVIPPGPKPVTPKTPPSPPFIFGGETPGRGGARGSVFGFGVRGLKKHKVGIIKVNLTKMEREAYADLGGIVGRKKTRATGARRKGKREVSLFDI